MDAPLIDYDNRTFGITIVPFIGRLIEDILLVFYKRHDRVIIHFRIYTTTKFKIDDGNPPSCIRFFKRREIDRHLLMYKTTMVNPRRLLYVKTTLLLKIVVYSMQIDDAFTQNRRLLYVKTTVL